MAFFAEMDQPQFMVIILPFFSFLRLTWISWISTGSAIA
jgi:hypothetical protein